MFLVSFGLQVIRDGIMQLVSTAFLCVLVQRYTQQFVLVLFSSVEVFSFRLFRASRGLDFREKRS